MVSLSGKTMSRAKACEKGFVFMHSLQPKAHLAFCYGRAFNELLQRRKLIDRLGKNDWLV